MHAPDASTICSLHHTKTAKAEQAGGWNAIWFILMTVLVICK